MRESCQYCLCVRGCVGVPELDIIRFLLFVHILAVHDSCWHRTQKYRLCDLNKSRCTQIAVAWSQRYERTHDHPSVGLLVCRRHNFAAGWLIAMINGRTNGWRNEHWHAHNRSLCFGNVFKQYHTSKNDIFLSINTAVIASVILQFSKQRVTYIFRHNIAIHFVYFCSANANSSKWGENRINVFPRKTY